MSTSAAGTGGQPGHPGTAREVLRTFLLLGLTSFGGPVAHLAFFREAFVHRRRWLTEEAYADLVALCQFLPGPASSQVGMAIGLHRAGWRGLLAAWAAFTLPSAVLMVGFAHAVPGIAQALGDGWLRGLTGAAVGVVAHAVLGMARTLTPDVRRAVVAVAALLAALAWDHPGAQVAVIAGGAVAGRLLLGGRTGTCTRRPRAARGPSRVCGAAALTALVGLLVGLPLLAAGSGDPVVRLADAFYRTGALVFGGGHVVLPLLETQVVRTGLVDGGTFLAGYGAAQAVPGPLFTVAAYLGASADGVDGTTGAVVALVAVFLPGTLLVVGALPFWERLRRRPAARSALRGTNAAVVGLLASSLAGPVVLLGTTSPATLVLAGVVFLVLVRWHPPVWAVVPTAAVLGHLLL